MMHKFVTRMYIPESPLQLKHVSVDNTYSETFTCGGLNRFKPFISQPTSVNPCFFADILLECVLLNDLPGIVRLGYLGNALDVRQVMQGVHNLICAQFLQTNFGAFLIGVPPDNL